MTSLVHKIGYFIFFALMISIAWNSVDILLRRWWWQQIPSQIGAFAVYLLLFSNALFILWQLRPSNDRLSRLSNRTR